MEEVFSKMHTDQDKTERNTYRVKNEMYVALH